MDAAKDWLRQKGLAGAAKREGRERERGRDRGRRRRPDSGNVGALVELNCETDFVAKGDVFRRAVAGLTRLVLEQGDADLGAKPYEGATVDDFVKGLSGTLGEKIELGRVGPVRDRRRPPRRLQARPERARRRRRARRARRRRPGTTPQAREVAHDIALHIASAAPRYVSRDDVPADDVDKERAILEAQTREEGKPEQAIGEDRRGQAQRVLQDGRAARAAVRQGPEDDDQGARRRPGRRRAACAASPASRSARSKQPYRTFVDAAANEESPMPESRYRRVVLKLSGEAFADQRIGYGIDAEVVAAHRGGGRRRAPRSRRRDRDRRRRRQHLPGHERRDARHGPRPRRLHGHARDGHQRARACRTRSSRSASRHACRPRSAWRRWPSRTSRCARSGISRRAGSSSSPAATGNPYFTTDTTAALRAAEIHAEALLKGTHSGVDGVYSADPALDPDAVKLERLSHFEVLSPRAAGDGLDRDHVLHGQPAPDHRVRRVGAGEHHAGARGRAHRHAGELEGGRRDASQGRRSQGQDAQGGRAPPGGVLVRSAPAARRPRSSRS